MVEQYNSKAKADVSQNLGPSSQTRLTKLPGTAGGQERRLRGQSHLGCRPVPGGIRITHLLQL
jgi:hypothetical protein